MKSIAVKLICAIAVVIILVVTYRYVLNELGLLHAMPWPGPEKPLPFVTTRSHLLLGKLTPGHTRYDYAAVGNIPGMSPAPEIPEDIVIIIHGFNNPPEKALYMIALAQKTLEYNGFDGAVIGFSWDADTQYDPISATGFHSGSRNTVANGPKLARFIIDYKERTNGARVHIMGYSLGARLALEVVKALDEDPAFADTHWKVDSVHLAGAAVDNEEVEVGKRYGEAIERRAGILVNYYSHKDNILGALFPIKEYDRALGETDIEHREKKPFNYLSMDAEKELLTFDSKGNPRIGEVGDNHMTCLGYIDADGRILADGIMDIVAGVIKELKESGLAAAES